MFHITQLCNVSHYIIVSHLLLLPNTTYSTVVQMCLCEGAIGRLFKFRDLSLQPSYVGGCSEEYLASIPVTRWCWARLGSRISVQKFYP